MAFIKTSGNSWEQVAAAINPGTPNINGEFLAAEVGMTNFDIAGKDWGITVQDAFVKPEMRGKIVTLPAPGNKPDIAKWLAYGAAFYAFLKIIG